MTTKATHICYTILLAIAILFAHFWMQEHDARVIAEQQIKAHEVNVKALQAQVVDTQAQADRTVAAIRARVVFVKTPTQAVAAIPEMSAIPLNATPAPDNRVTVDAVPLFQELAQCKEDAVQLAACRTEATAKDAIIVNTRAEVVVLKKKPALLKRIKNVAKAVGIGIAIGFVLAHGVL
jgi:small-conductance mechanosensitive channel